MELPGIRSAAELSQTPVGADANTGSTDGAFGELGQTQFLELFIAQLNNQNPLDPAKNEEFIAQLAQFSSVEGIQNLNESVSQMAVAMQSSLTFDAASLVGRSVMVPSGRVAYQGEPVAGSIDIPESTDGLLVEINRPSGELVRRIELGPMEQGFARFLWDGSDAAGENAGPGQYQIRAFSLTDSGRVEFDIRVPDRVSSVTLSDGGVLANLASGNTISAAQIREIQ